MHTLTRETTMKLHALLRTGLLALAAGLGLVWPLPACAQKGGDFLKSSKQVVEAFRPVVARPSESTVRVRCDGKDAALGTVTGANGWILTKASMLKGKITCKLKDGRELPAALVGVHEPYDLAMLKVEAAGLTPVTWEDAKAASVGRWAASVGPGADPVAIGVISVATRPFKAGDQPPKTPNTNSGFLGIGLEEAEGGAKVTSVMPKSAAAKAGLKVDDIVTHVNKTKILDAESLINAVGRHKPGAEIVLKVNRGKEKMEMKATLGRRPPGFAGNPQERMGSALSNRRGGFPSILQHDSVLAPGDCGGPLVDVDGKAVGINIARAGRTETYAVPADAVRAVLADLMAGNLPPPMKEE
jgi:serine protease Do